MFKTIFLMALRELQRNKMRSMLTALGIIIGVAAVVSLVTVGQSATAKVTSDVAKMGDNLIFIRPRMEPGKQMLPFKMADVEAITRELSSVAAAAPEVSRSVQAVVGNRNRTLSVTGSTNDYLAIRSYTLSAGRAFTVGELAGGRVCLLGATAHKELFGAHDALGESVRLGQSSCEVIGVLAAKGEATMGFDQDDFVLMPIKTVQRRLTGNNDVSSIVVSAVNAASIDRAKSGIEGLLDQRRRNGAGEARNFHVMDPREIADTLKTITGVLTALLGAIAAVSLLVGGIGIMNIMLVSVTERTREIGLRMAIGARAHEVMYQFLFEAVVLSGLGGVVGILLGLGGSYLGTHLMNMPFIFVPWVALLAFFFSAAVGVVFGFLPARKAAQLDPIEALRHE